MEIVRRLGVPPKERGSANDVSCPDIFELQDGRLAFIGTDMTQELAGELPEGAVVAPYERVVVITRQTLLDAKQDIVALEPSPVGVTLAEPHQSHQSHP